MSAYATLDDVRRVLALGGDSDATHDPLLTQMLDDVSRDVDAMCGRSFGVTVEGTVALFDVLEPSPSLASATRGRGSADGRALDLVAVTKVEVRDSESSAYVEVPAGDAGYHLQPGMGPGIAGEDWPWEDVVLSPALGCLPTGFRAVRVTGTLGFPHVPSPVARAVASEVRERFRQGVSGGAAPQGVNQFGTPIFVTGDSPDMQRLGRAPYRKRTHSVA